MIDDIMYERYELTNMICHTNVEHNVQHLHSSHNYYNAYEIKMFRSLPRKIGYANYYIILNILIISFIDSQSPKIARKIDINLHGQLIYIQRSVKGGYLLFHID